MSYFILYDEEEVVPMCSKVNLTIVLCFFLDYIPKKAVFFFRRFYFYFLFISFFLFLILYSTINLIYCLMITFVCFFFFFYDRANNLYGHRQLLLSFQIEFVRCSRNILLFRNNISKSCFEITRHCCYNYY